MDIFGMINFYRLCLPGTAEVLTPLNVLLHRKFKGKALIAWSSTGERCFMKLKDSLE